MKTHAELVDDVAGLESECRTLETAAFNRGQMPKGRPMLSRNPTTEQLVDHVSFLESYAADLRIQDRLSRPLKGVNSSAKPASGRFQAIDELLENDDALRTKLESIRPGCTSHVPKAEKNSTLDQRLESIDLLKAIERLLAPQSSTQSAQSAKPLTLQLRDGDVTVKQMNIACEVMRIEKLIATTKEGSKTHAALSSKISRLRDDYAKLPESKK